MTFDIDMSLWHGDSTGLCSGMCLYAVWFCEFTLMFALMKTKPFKYSDVNGFEPQISFTILRDLTNKTHYYKSHTQQILVYIFVNLCF